MKEYIELNNGVRMPLVGLGTWTLKGYDLEQSVTAALDFGYKLFDTANLYDNEKELGDVLLRNVKRGGGVYCVKSAAPSDERYKKTPLP